MSPKHVKKRNIRLLPTKKAYIAILIVMGLVSIAFLSVMAATDIFPEDLTFLMIAVMIGLLVAADLLFTRNNKITRIIGILVAVLFIAAYSASTYYLTNTYAMLNSISAGSLDASGPLAKKVSVTEEPFNIYVTGIDQWASEEGLDLERSDVNMIVTVNPVTKKVLLTSIPRDSYVKLHTAQQMDKLTHTGIYGVDETLNTVEDWFGIKINYYVKMNFTAVKDIINAMGGIKVYSPVAFESSLKGYKYKKGWNRLSGKQALYFVRERKSFEGQDSIRVENQQRVMKAMIKRLTTHTVILTRYGEIMSATGKNLTTNMSSEEMQELVKMQLTDLSEWDVQSQKIEGEYGEEFVASLAQTQRYSVYLPDEKSVKSAVAGIEKIMNPSEAQLEEARKNRSKSLLVNLVNSTIESVQNKEEEEEKEKEK